MHGFLVVNHYLHGGKYNELHNHLLVSAKNKGVDLDIVTNENAIFSDEKPDFVLFWDKDTILAKAFENRGIPVFNSSRSIELCDDKAKNYLALENKFSQPKTIVAPLSFFAVDYSRFVNTAVEKLGLPVVFKERCGSFGEQVHLCQTVDEVMNCINGKPFLLQEYVECNNSDVRLEVVGDRVVAAMKRHNDNDFRSNITNGGIASVYTPTEYEKQTAVAVCKELGLTFGGVDILPNGAVCEVNSNAHIINIMNTTGVDVAPLIFDEISEKIKQI